jgi:MAF protein
MPATPLIILASGSTYRRQLLEKLQIPFLTESPDIDETGGAGESAQALVTRLSLAKANALSSTYPHALIIGSDQVALLGEQILTKPGTHANARTQLQQCSSRSVTFLTGICLLNSASGGIRQTIASTRVSFRELTAEQIEHYLLQEQPYDCAGSFKAEGLGIALFDAIASDDPTSLIGLPLIALTRMLDAEGVDVLTARSLAN